MIEQDYDQQNDQVDPPVEKQLQLLYIDYAKKKGFRDYTEFRSLIDNSSNRRMFFDQSNK